MKQIITTVYDFDELSDKAKEKARDWFKETLNNDTFWHECVIEDAKELAKFLGIKIDKVYFSGFSSQGDGACFIGEFNAKNVNLNSLIASAPKEEELHRIAKQIAEIVKEYPNLAFNTKHNTVRYNHENSVNFYFDDDFNDDAEPEVKDEVTDLARDFMRWIYKKLEQAWDYENSNECVDENIRANGYTFKEDGERFG